MCEKRDILKSLLLILLAGFIFISCGNRGKTIVIGVSECSDDIWRGKLNMEMQIETYLYGNVELRIVSTEDDDRVQEQQINDFIESGVDLIIVAPNQTHPINDVINAAYNKNIPVIEFGRKADTENYTAFIGPDNYFMGKSMAEFIVFHLGGKGKIVELQGIKDATSSMDRHNGFVEVLEKFPRLQIIDSRCTNWTVASGKAAMDSVLATNKDFDCVFAHNDRLAEGARKAVTEAGIDRDIAYTGIDALTVEGGGIPSVKNGDFAASYIYPTRGDLVIQLAMDVLEGRPYERDNYLQSSIVTPDNVDLVMLQDQEMTLQQGKLITLKDDINMYLVQYNHQKVYQLLLGIIILLIVGIAVFIYHTISARHKEAEEAANAKLQFFTNVSHEFRAPLTLISDPVDRLLEDGTMDKEQRDLLEMVQKNVAIMLNLTNEILDFRKVQAGKMEVEPSDFDLAERMREWVDSFVPFANNNKTRIVLDAPSSLKVYTDQYKTERILYNLLSNALKYTGGNGTVSISLKETDKMVSISVSDTGIGISAETLPRIFDQFYQAKGSIRGTGIGLALVKAFSELLGGAVGVESKEGEGTTFTVTLLKNMREAADFAKQQSPAESSETKNAKKMTDKVTDPEAQGEKPIVLLVDDSIDLLNYLESVLGKSYETITALNGKDGFEKAVKNVPDVIISDVMMPVMDGFEMCDALKKEIATSHIPIILLTAKAGDESHAQGYDCGADAYLTKPFSSKVLLARVKNILENRKVLRDYFLSGEVDMDRPTDPDKIFLDKFHDTIIANLSNSEFSVETLGDEMNLSRVQLYRKSKTLTGYSPVELIRITRLRKANQLLKNGGLTSSEVCYRVGFSSPSYFTKCYKEYFGHTPSETD